MTDRPRAPEPSEPRQDRVAAVGIPALLMGQIEAVCESADQDVTQYIVCAIERALHVDLDAQQGTLVDHGHGPSDDMWYAWATHLAGALGLSTTPVSMRTETSGPELQRAIAARCGAFMRTLVSYRELVRGELDRMDELLGKPDHAVVDSLVDAIMSERPST